MRLPQRRIPVASCTIRNRFIGPYSSNSRFSFFSVVSKLIRETNSVLKASPCRKGTCLILLAVQSNVCRYKTGMPREVTRHAQTILCKQSTPPVHEDHLWDSIRLPLSEQHLLPASTIKSQACIHTLALQLDSTNGDSMRCKVCSSYRLLLLLKYSCLPAGEHALSKLVNKL